ncbi:DNA polymerase III subunit gamma/tau [Verrucomicrobiota bacterium]
MAYEVLARKWRPRQFADVVGQDHVIRTLKNAIKTNRTAHAYLFVGPRGVGKTSIARILAKALNCEKGPTEKPCDKCSSCTEIAAGTNLDVEEIDGASNRGIDEIRALREKVKYVPSGRYRIYIIDEVHALTIDAFNALLKTLEEPPPHIKFFFATTEPQKIPLTILSRCQRFDLRRIHAGLLMERLAKIAETEKVSVEKDALLALARAAEGSLRDAESGLDQLISFQGKTIRERDVLDVFGLVSRDAMEKLTTALLKGDVVNVIHLVEDFDKKGKDMQRLLVELLEHCLNLLVFLQAGKDVSDLDLTGALPDVLKEQADLTNVDRLLRITEILVETMDRLRYALSKKTLLETALIRCTRASVMVSLDDLLKQVKDLKKGLSSGADITSGGAESKPEAPGAELFPDKSASAPISPSLLRDKPVVSESKKAGPAEKDELLLLKKSWHSILERVGKVTVLAKNCLLDAEPIAIVDDKVTIGFDPEFPDRIEQAKVTRNRNVLQKTLSQVLRRPVSAEFELMSRSSHEKEPGPTNAAGAGSDAGNVRTKGESDKVQTGSKQKWRSNEAVRKTIDMFNGTITDIKE